MSKYRVTDLWFTESGDLSIDSHGDLEDTNSNYGRAIIQEVKDRLKSSQGDWKLQRSIGANLQVYLGEASTSKNLELISSRIKDALSFDRLLTAGEFQVIPLEIGKSAVIFRIIIHTPEGDLAATLGYDSDNQCFMGY